MRLQIALVFVALLGPSPTPAQTQQKSPPQHQPGVAATPADAPAGAQTPAAAAPGTPVAEKVDPAKDAAIRHLMDVTGTSKMGETVSKGINSQVEATMKRAIVGPRLQKFMEDFSQRFNETAPSAGITDTTVAIYARHFTTEDIEGMTKFYESPVGQKVLKELPDAQQESFSSSQDVARQAAMKVLRSMSDEYTELQRMLPPDPNKPEVKPASPSPGATPGTPGTPAPGPPQPPQPPTTPGKKVMPTPQ